MCYDGHLFCHFSQVVLGHKLKLLFFSAGDGHTRVGVRVQLVDSQISLEAMDLGGQRSLLSVSEIEL